MKGMVKRVGIGRDNKSVLATSRPCESSLLDAATSTPSRPTPNPSMQQIPSGSRTPTHPHGCSRCSFLVSTGCALV
jgi:hypothetical protein